MRNTSSLDALFPAVRQKVLTTTLLHPERGWYLSDLARHLDVRPSSLQRELPALATAGILKRHRDGNRTYYQADPDCPFLPDLQGLLVRTAGIADVVQDALRPFVKKVRFAFLYGSVARKEEVPGSDVDVLVVGSVSLADVAPAVRAAEEQIGRPVNPTLYTPSEFAEKTRAGHHFLTTVLKAPKIFLLGNDTDVDATLGRTPRAAAQDEQGGTRRAPGRRRTRPQGRGRQSTLR